MSPYPKGGLPGQLRPYTWPQDTLRIPNANGRFMPPVELGNIDLARQESFTMVGTFTYPSAAAGSQLRLVLPTDQDGDFWCDQIYLVGWGSPVYQSQEPEPATLSIRDLRTGQAITYPTDSVPIKFFATLILFSDDVGFDVGGSPLPDGFRSTCTLPQPHCFTRQGGIEIVMTFLYAVPANAIRTLDIAFSGWKEYTYASQGQAPQAGA